jgi:hypothetical protein
MNTYPTVKHPEAEAHERGVVLPAPELGHTQNNARSVSVCPSIVVWISASRASYAQVQHGGTGKTG